MWCQRGAALAAPARDSQTFITGIWAGGQRLCGAEQEFSCGGQGALLVPPQSPETGPELLSGHLLVGHGILEHKLHMGLVRTNSEFGGFCCSFLKAVW